MAPVVIALLTSALLAPVPPAEPAPKAPKGPPPQLCLAQAKGEGGPLLMQVFVTRMLPLTRTRVEERAGRKVEVTETIYKSVVEQKTVLVDGTGVLVSRKDGKALPMAKVRELLARQKPVLYFATGELDPFYLTVIKDDTLIISRPPPKPKP